MTGLLLNPRLPEETATLFRKAWETCVTDTPEIFGGGTIGISTSGSTGGVGSIIVLSQEALEASARAVNRRIEAQPEDIWGSVLPLFHVGGYSIPVRARLSNSKVAGFSSSWDPAVFCKWLDAEGVTLLSLVPTQLFDLVEGGYRSPTKLRAVIVGGGRLDESIHARALSLGWPVLQSYGMTECCSQIATARLGTDGRLLEVLDHVEVRVNSETQRLSVRSKSLLSARIKFVLSGDRYYPLLEKPVDREGWFETSDRAVVEQKGVLRILGREGETVKVLGELVDLARVRAVVEEIAASSDEFRKWQQHTWVIAVPDERREHEIVLVTDTPEEMAKSPAAEKVEKRFFEKLKGRLAPFEVPTRVVWVDEIPRSDLGKVLSTVLTERVRNSRRR